MKEELKLRMPQIESFDIIMTLTPDCYYDEKVIMFDINKEGKVLGGFYFANKNQVLQIIDFLQKHVNSL